MRNIFEKMPNWLLVAISFIVLALSAYFIILVASLFLGTLGLRPVAQERIPAPDFTLFDVDAQKVTLSDFRGQKVILSFWTTWNEISLEQLNILHLYHQSIPSDSVVVLAINSQEDGGTIREFLKNVQIGFPVLQDREGEVGELYNISVLPLTVFIDTNGFESERFIGLVPFQKIQDAQKRL